MHARYPRAMRFLYEDSPGTRQVVIPPDNCKPRVCGHAASVRRHFIRQSTLPGRDQRILFDSRTPASAETNVGLHCALRRVVRSSCCQRLHRARRLTRVYSQVLRYWPTYASKSAALAKLLSRCLWLPCYKCPDSGLMARSPASLWLQVRPAIGNTDTSRVNRRDFIAGRRAVTHAPAPFPDTGTHPKGGCAMNRLIAVILVGMISMTLAVAASAQVLKITNEAGGIACYASQDLLEAHSAIGFYNFKKVQLLIARDKCFVMQKHWKPRITDEHIIGGANVKMVHVRLDNMGRDMRIAWSLLLNFEFIGD